MPGVACGGATAYYTNGQQGPGPQPGQSLLESGELLLRSTVRERVEQEEQDTLEWEPEVVTKETSSVLKLKAEPGWLGEGGRKEKGNYIIKNSSCFGGWLRTVPHSHPPLTPGGTQTNF